jgi:hypothetical protein
MNLNNSDSTHVGSNIGLQIAKQLTPDIEYEMSELCRRYSIQRISNRHLKFLRATSKDQQENIAREQSDQNEAPCPSESAQNKAGSSLFDDPYDNLFQKLMNWRELGDGPFLSDACAIGNLDLNAPR